MTPQIAKIIQDLSTVLTHDELVSRVSRLNDAEATALAASTAASPSPIRGKSYLEWIDTTEELFPALYLKNVGSEVPEGLVPILKTHNLDSMVLMDYMRETLNFNAYAGLQKIAFLIRGKSFVREFRTHRVDENQSGQATYRIGGGGGKSKPPTNDTMLVGAVPIRFPKKVEHEPIVAYAAPDEFWNSKKPAEAVMTKLFLFGVKGIPVTQEVLNDLMKTFGVTKEKEVAEQIKWTMDGSYSKYGWEGKFFSDTMSFSLSPIGWDGLSIPEGGKSYAQYRAEQKASKKS